MVKIIIIILMLTLISGCSINENKNLNIQPPYEQLDAKGIAYMEKFKTVYPNSEIISKSAFDIDNDGEKDLLIIYNDFYRKTRSNFAIVNKSGITVVDLSDNKTKFKFANGADSLKLLKNPNRFIISLEIENVNPKKIVDFQITATYDNEFNRTNIIIKSLNFN